MSKTTESVSYTDLEKTLSEASETNLNGSIAKASSTEKSLDLTGIQISLNDEISCQQCGHSLGITSSLDSKSCKEIACKSCAVTERSVESPVFDDDLDVANKRDSGFHTMKREEKNEDPEHSAPALSASSSDSAVSVGFGDGVAMPEQSEGGNNIPAIIIDTDNGAGWDTSDFTEDAKTENDQDDQSDQENGLNGTDFKETPVTLAEKLFYFKGIKRMEVASHISKNNEFSKEVGKEYLKHFNFSEVSLIDAYREFLSRFALLGETQERERILLYFSERYVACNPQFLDGDADSVFTLICSLTFLNTDLHGNLGFSSGRKKMTSKLFTARMAGLMPDKSDYPKELLHSLFSSVKKNPLPWGGKEQRKLPRSSSMRQNTEADSAGLSPTKIVNRSLSVRTPVKSGKTSDPNSASTSRSGMGRSAKMKSLSTNQGLLWRKVLFDSEGKKVSLGKRGWKVYSVALQNLELHIVKRGTSEAKRISLHHSWAEDSTNDSKRQNVFRVTLADTSVTLYQASNDKETRKWVKDINKAAALLSAAPLCSPIGSQLIFRKPLLPSAPSTLPLANQHEKMQELLREHEMDLEDTEKNFDSKSSPQHQQYFKDKTIFLKSEIVKYRNYVKILQLRLRTSTAFAHEPETNLEASGGSSESGSLVSVTPSEPPLASPSPFHISDNFVFPDSDSGDHGSPTASGYPPGGLAAPAHLVSPQHRHLVMTPTTSLPNLSPIMEGAPPIKSDPKSDDASFGSLRRRRKEMNMYESTINDTTDTVYKANVNNSNHVAMVTNFSNSRITSVPPHIIQSAMAAGVHFPSYDVKNPSGNDLPHVRHPGQDKPSPPGLLNGSFQTTKPSLFPVKRYELHIAEMNSTHDHLSRCSKMDATAEQKQMISRGTETGRNEGASNQYLQDPLGPTTHFSGATHPVLPKAHTQTLTRVRGRREKKGIERYSYMQAVSFPENL